MNVVRERALELIKIYLYNARINLRNFDSFLNKINGINKKQTGS